MRARFPAGVFTGEFLRRTRIGASLRAAVHARLAQLEALDLAGGRLGQLGTNSIQRGYL
jgi:hypothetical protein